MKNIIKNKLFLGVSAGLALALLSGCGGGGSGSASNLLSGANGDSVADAAGKAPRFGSVSQSSTGDGATTTDTVDIRLSYDVDIQVNGDVTMTINNGLVYEVTYESPDGGVMVTVGNSNLHRTLPLNQEEECIIENGICSGYELVGRDGDGTYWVDLYTHLPGDATLTVTDTTNWLAGGIWLYIPDDASSVEDVEAGAFGDGGDPFTTSDIQGLAGSAFYQGFATGIYAEYGEDFGEDIGYFDADVSLMASFDDVGGGGSAWGEVSGAVYNFESHDGQTFDFTLDLEAAGIETTGDDAGFFRGTAQGDDDDGDTWVGRWGGSFYGNSGSGSGASKYPEAIGGTFGATCSEATAGSGCDNDEEYWGTLLGAFGATR